MKYGFQAFVIGFTLLFVETAFFHILNFTSDYLNATLIISFALIGISIGATCSFYMKKYRTTTFAWLIIGLICSIILAFVSIVSSPGTFMPTLMLPFILGSIAISYLFMKRNSKKIYFYDMLGAAAGVLSAIYLIPLKTENTLIICLILLSLVVSIRYFKISIGLAAMFFILLIFNFSTGFLDLENITRCDQDRGFCECRENGEHFFASDNLVSRISVCKYPSIDTSIYSISFNGDVNDIITDVAYWRNDFRIPLQYDEIELFERDPRVLVIGTSAQGILKPLKSMVNHSNIHGLELNPSIVRLMQKEFYNFSRKAYGNITVDIIDARTYLRRSNRTFDLITLLNTYVARNLGHVQPDYLHTVEAFNEYFRILDDGYLLIEERIETKDASDALQIILNNLDAALGNIDDKSLIYRQDIRDDKYLMILVKKSRFTNDEIGFFDSWINTEKDIGVTTLIHLPQQGSVNITGITSNDDRPYLTDRIDNENMIFIGILCLSLLMLNIYLLKRNFNKIHIKYLFYFSLIGLAYFIIEIGLINFYLLSMGSPTRTFIFIVGALILSTGIGSYFGTRWSFLGIILISLAHLFLRDIDNIFWITLLVMSLGFFMGSPLPLGIERLKRINKKTVHLFYAVNSIFSALAIILGLYLSVSFGFTALFITAIVLYMVAFLLIK